VTARSDPRAGIPRGWPFIAWSARSWGVQGHALYSSSGALGPSERKRYERRNGIV